MVSCSIYTVWKKVPHCQDYIKRLDFIYYNNIILYISDNTHVLPIPPMNTTHTTLRKTGGTGLISTVESLHIGPFILHTSPFQPVVQGGIVYRKKPFFLLRQRSCYRMRMETMESELDFLILLVASACFGG
jgi:hypothetical protein